MNSVISTLKLIVKNKMTNLPLSGVNINWAKIPENVKSKGGFYQKTKYLFDGLQIDITNQSGFCLLNGTLLTSADLRIYIHRIFCHGFKELIIGKRVFIKSDSVKEFLVYLYPDNE
ncbi:MAG: hypothetical protein HOC71_16650 [Candidatus Latescibacteria bacterium]|jgi:hypothetical protein|nr:hypothetical protein [Candidatus Latescibacterota bacterium]